MDILLNLFLQNEQLSFFNFNNISLTRECKTSSKFQVDLDAQKTLCRSLLPWKLRGGMQACRLVKHLLQEIPAGQEQ